MAVPRALITVFRQKRLARETTRSLHVSAIAYTRSIAAAVVVRVRGRYRIKKRKCLRVPRSSVLHSRMDKRNRTARGKKKKYYTPSLIVFDRFGRFKRSSKYALVFIAPDAFTINKRVGNYTAKRITVFILRREMFPPV